MSNEYRPGLGQAHVFSEAELSAIRKEHAASGLPSPQNKEISPEERERKNTLRSIRAANKELSMFLQSARGNLSAMNPRNPVQIFGYNLERRKPDQKAMASQEIKITELENHLTNMAKGLAALEHGEPASDELMTSLHALQEMQAEALQDVFAKAKKQPKSYSTESFQQKLRTTSDLIERLSQARK